MEWIMPVIFVVVWALSKMFGGKREEEQGEPDSSSPPVEVDRTREIQEEIRRRIAQRRKTQQPAPESAHTETPAQLQPQSMHPQQQAGTGQTTLRPATVQTPTQTLAPASPFQQAQVQPEEPETPIHAHSLWEQSLPAPEELDEQQQLQRRLQQMREAKIHAERVKWVKSWGKSRKSIARRHGSRANIRSEVIDSLRDPSGPRKAIIYMEVLGAPVSVRQDSGFLHFWEQR